MKEQFRALILRYSEMGHTMEHFLKGRQQLDIWRNIPSTTFSQWCLRMRVHGELIVKPRREAGRAVTETGYWSGVAVS